MVPSVLDFRLKILRPGRYISTLLMGKIDW
jgi:hypothetical protein